MKTELNPADAVREAPMNDLQRMLADLRLIESGELPDGDGVGVSVSLWAERWIPRLAALAGAAPDVESLSESDKDVALAQAVEFAEYVERQAKGAMADAARRFMSLPYSQEIATRLTSHAPAKAREVTDADVERACNAYDNSAHKEGDWADNYAMRAALATFAEGER